MIQSLSFYLFAVILIASALMVISARNPVHSVLFLILSFFSAAGLFILLGAEFIGLILVIVYVGAVAVLFLFVVMMLDIDFATLRKGAMQYVPLGLVAGGVFLLELCVLFLNWAFAPGIQKPPAGDIESAQTVENTRALGEVLYTDYFLAFQLAGIILLVAMIGSIVLTHRVRPNIRRQSVTEQVSRNPADVLTIEKITPGSGA